MKKFIISFGVLMLLAPLGAMAVPNVHSQVSKQDRLDSMDESNVFDEPGSGRSAEVYK